jgi:hypothetical protein
MYDPLNDELLSIATATHSIKYSPSTESVHLQQVQAVAEPGIEMRGVEHIT